MTKMILNSIIKTVSLSWLTGPIFDKELRVSSRRRRNYVLRAVYLVLLTIFVGLVWAQEVNFGGGNSVYRISRMANAGRTIVMTIVWFQFIAAQVVAGIILSTAISDEIYNRTLGVLMTTPINSFQIVTGKLFSKLLQVILLLAITLPLLAVVRVFGGVPWDFLLASLCITLSTVIFIGSLSLFFSIFTKKAYIVIILTTITVVTAFALAPFLAGLTCKVVSGDWPGSQLTHRIFFSNPYYAMGSISENFMIARSTGTMTGLSWLLHCGIVLGCSLAILLACVLMVRKVALAQVTGQALTLFGTDRKPNTKNPVRRDVPIRPVTNNPVLWKEICYPLLGRNKSISITIVSFALLVALITYVLMAHEDMFDEAEMHMVYGTIYMGLGLLFTFTLGASSVTSEKESRSWPLLLATTLTDYQILNGKLIGTIRRIFIAWIPLFVHIAVFTLMGHIHRVAIFQIAILVAWIIIFLTGTGIYFSTCFKRTTTAVVLNLSLAAGIWAVFPLFMVMCLAFSNSSGDILELYMDTNPFVHLCAIIDGTTPRDSTPLRYSWIGFSSLNVAQTTIWIIVCGIIYSSIGVGFAVMAKNAFRKKIFHAG